VRAIGGRVQAAAGRTWGMLTPARRVQLIPRCCLLCTGRGRGRVLYDECAHLHGCSRNADACGEWTTLSFTSLGA
jgi:hypothetical protein